MKYKGRSCTVHAGIWWENMRKRGHLEDLSVDGSTELIKH